MKRVEYEAPDGRLYAVLIPDDALPSTAKMGIVIGPPELDSITYIPPELLVAVHNQLYRRGILTYADARRRKEEIQTSVLTALKGNLMRDILGCYERVNNDAANRPA